MRLAGAFGLALYWLLVGPEPLAAWGPGTHVALGSVLLSALDLLPLAVREIVGRFPRHFLYGSIAADISFAKKYVPEGRHCHHWHVGEEILARADTDPLRAVGYGYLAHLAADTVAHNLFVPRRLLLTSTTQALGHAYWEHRMDIVLGEAHLATARRLVTEYDHEDADALFDRVLSATIFSFQTNRRIFRGMVRFSDNDRWRTVFEQVLRNTRFPLPAPLVERYVAVSFDRIVDYLNEREHSRTAVHDPIGDLNLRLAKKVRRLSLARGAAADPEELVRSADEFFPLPDDEGGIFASLPYEVRQAALPAPSAAGIIPGESRGEPAEATPPASDRPRRPTSA
ncbi:MAG: hypothetical protein D6701_01455 [Gemmatimonadetes bacterium]|nr:MAG: hypothetical protein D6701_01455 [Gemmatimonadota bacterium]